MSWTLFAQLAVLIPWATICVGAAGASVVRVLNRDSGEHND